jgi:hypothetical protein
VAMGPRVHGDDDSSLVRDDGYTPAIITYLISTYSSMP